MKRIALFIIAMSFALLSLNVHAQDQPAINQTVSELINKYQSTEGINSINLKKGEGLGIAKLAMRKHFGSKFLRGIEQIAHKFLFIGQLYYSITQSANKESIKNTPSFKNYGCFRILLYYP